MSAQLDADVAAPVPSEQEPVAGVNPPQARAPGLDPQPGLDRRRIAAWYAVFAGYAALLAVFSRHADQSWGIWASGGYLLAAITAVLYRRPRGRDAALLAAAAGALAGPLTWLAIRAPATADVQVVARAATLLLRHSSRDGSGPAGPVGPARRDLRPAQPQAECLVRRDARHRYQNGRRVACLL
jgi:hypothetical protein